MSGLPRAAAGGLLAALCTAGLALVPAGPSAADASAASPPAAGLRPEAPRTERLSVTADGREAPEGGAAKPSISADGRYAAFASSGRLLGETEPMQRIYVRDLKTGALDAASVTDRGAPAGGVDPGISADGRFVTWASRADGVVAGDANRSYDIFVRDRKKGTTVRASLTAQRATRPPYDLSYEPVISANGRHVAFYSQATDLVPGDTNGRVDVFVHDLRTRTTERVSVASDGTQADDHSSEPALSADGRYAGFSSWSSNLGSGNGDSGPAVYVRDRRKGTTTREAAGGGPSLSGDGRRIAYEVSDTESPWHSRIRVRDRVTGEDTVASVAPDGGAADASSSYPALSGDGRSVAFSSYAANLVPGDTNGTGDVFVRDLRTRSTTRASVSTDGIQGSGAALWGAALDAAGRRAVFTSTSPDLVPGDTNATSDVFLRRLR
ncbi:hypothetical protein [Streptomyces sp. ODS28]|uniref:TolB family protein n=1 Tax=Streptomyces sp. ODS28 TaxID=3136688 RepID=UPI0031EEE15F